MAVRHVLKQQEEEASLAVPVAEVGARYIETGAIGEVLVEAHFTAVHAVGGGICWTAGMGDAHFAKIADGASAAASPA